jgi:predicted amino acid racemase
MARLSELADSIEATLGLAVEIVSGGNSANLEWALSGAEIGRINDLRLGEAILLGCETLHRQPIDGLYTDAITLCAEVIEAKLKPSMPLGTIAQNAFGEIPAVIDRGLVTQAILAVGQQDVDPSGLQAPNGMDVMGASSDHLILESEQRELTVGAEVIFQVNYGALVRAMTSPFVTKVMEPALV